MHSMPWRMGGLPDGPESLGKGSHGFAGLDNDMASAGHEARVGSQEVNCND